MRRKTSLTLILFLFLMTSFSNLSLATTSDWESGYIDVTKKDHLFYLLTRSKKADAPLVIYLSGGPGASSLGPAFFENGPFNLEQPFHHDTDLQLTKNPWAWNRLANIVYLDQPRYTGFSYGTGPYVTSIQETGQDFLSWIEKFYQRYPEFQKRQLYIAGASFAGQYVPEFTHQIFLYNQQHPQQTIPLTGLFIQSGAIGIGDGGLDVSPRYQLLYLCTQHMLPQNACAPNKKNNLQGILNQCMTNIAAHQKIAIPEIKNSDVYVAAKSNKSCQTYLREVDPQPTAFKEMSVNGKKMPVPVGGLELPANTQVRQFLNYSPNPYNIKFTCQLNGGYPPWCYDNFKITHFFNSSTIKSWIGNGAIPANISWEFAKYPVALALGNNDYTPLNYYSEALKHHLRIIFLYGKNDWHMNYFAAQVLADQIVRGAYDEPLFKQLPANPSSMKNIINNKGQSMGEYQTQHNFTFVQVNDAGHEIGMDQPEVTYQLFASLLNISDLAQRAPLQN